MGLSKKILNFFLALTDWLTFWVRQNPDRIEFISLTQSELSGDFKQIYEALEKEHRYDLYTDLVDYKPGLKGKALYFFDCLKQMVEMKKSRLVILNDNNYVASTRKPKGTKVLQVWHACGAVKKFGNQIDRQYPIRNYDAVLACGDYWKEPFSKAFDVNPQQVKVTGLPRLDNLMDKGKMEAKVQELYAKYPVLKGKKVLLYAPTFRGNIVEGMYAVDFDGNKLAVLLGPDWIVVCKYHPLLKTEIKTGKNCLDLSEEELYPLMYVSNALVTDYSSVVFDYMLLDKPYIGYIPDLDVYKTTIGLNTDINELYVANIAQSETEIADIILDTNQKQVDNAHLYMKYADCSNTARIVSEINELMERS